MVASNSFEALLDALTVSFDFPMSDLSGHLTERVAGANTTSESALTYGLRGLPEVPGTAIGYGGSISGATAPSNAAFNLGDVCSVLVLFKRNVILTLGTLAFKDITGGGTGWTLFINGSDILTFADQSTFTTIVSSSVAVKDTTTIHGCLVTKNGATTKLYLDRYDRTVVGTNVTLTNTTDVQNVGNTNYNGTIYRVAGWKSALTADQAFAVLGAALAPGKPYADVVIPYRIGKRDMVPQMRHIPFVAPVITPASGPQTFLQTLTAGLSFTGTIIRQTAHGMTSGLSFTGALTKQISHLLPAGGLSFVGSIQKRVGKALSGGLSFTGAQSHQIGKALSGGLSFSGSLPRFITRGLTATLSFNGSLTKRVSHILPAAALSFNGSLATLKAFGVTLTASLSFNGSLQKRTGKALNGGLSFTGSLPRFVSRGLTATLGFTGSLTRRTSRTMSGSLSFSGNLTKRIAKTLTAALSFTSFFSAIKSGGVAIFTAVVGPRGQATSPAPNSVATTAAPNTSMVSSAPEGSSTAAAPNGTTDAPHPGD